MTRRYTNTAWMHDRLTAGVLTDAVGVEQRDPRAIGDSRLDAGFIELMKTRLMVGHFRYGIKAEQGVRYDTVGAILARAALYQETGNTEYLVDLANFCMLEFQHPSHPDAHFEAGDDNHEHAKEI
ncbi:MAG: hypothetical protein GY906_01570 [bacterium]|nr:hypothetical protein [bacterium]